jgi:hypothetical protein
MTTSESDLGELRERMTKLERQNRRVKQLGALALIAASSLLLIGQTATRNTIEANEFILRDNGGKIRARLYVDEKFEKYPTAQFVLFDKEGKQAVDIESGSLGSTGGTLKLADEHGQDRVYLSGSSGIGGTLSLLNEKGFPGSVLHTDFAELPTVTMKVVKTSFLALQTKDERYCGTISAGEDKSGSVTLQSADGKALTLGPTYVAFVDSVDSKSPTPRAAFERDGLFISDDQGFSARIGATELETPRTGETTKRPAASIVLFDRQNKVLWKVP